MAREWLLVGLICVRRFRLFDMIIPKRGTVSRCISEAYANLPGFSLIRVTSEDPRRRFSAHYTCGNLDFLVQNESYGVIVMAGRQRSTPRRFGFPGALDGMYYFEDIRTVLEDPEIPDISQLEFAEIANMLSQLQPRLESIFADRSERALRRAVNNRVAAGD